MRETSRDAKLGGPEDFTADGRCYTGERFILSLDEGQQLLGWLALVRACTLGQAARFGWAGDAAAAKLALEHMIWRQRWIGKVGPLRLPKGCGPGAKKLATVYYLTERGAQALARVAPRLARQARAGRPVGARLARLPHELLVAEAWLLTSSRREILEFWPETELKSQIVRSRMRRGGAAAAAGYVPDEATGDFKIRVRDRESEVCWWVEAEVAVRYRADQIKQKPQGMDWFVCDRRQAQLVELIKGVRPVMLADVTAPVGSEPGTGALPDTAQFRARVLRALDLMDGAATASCVQRIIGGWRSHVSRVLAHMESAGRLWHEDASIQPGRERGRPSKLYVREHLTFRSAHEVVRRACASQMVIDAKQENFVVEKYDATSGHLTLKSETGEAGFLCVIDDGSLTVTEYFGRLKEAEARAGGRRVLAVMSDTQRIAELGGTHQFQSIWDLLQRTRRNWRKDHETPAAPAQRRLALA